MPYHDEWEFAAKYTKRGDILLPHIRERFFNRGELVMGIERGFSQSGKMLATTQHARLA